MVTMYKTILITILVTLSACSKITDSISYSAPNFPNSSIANVRILNDQILLNRPWNMWIIDSVVILNTQNVDNMRQFQCFSVNNGTLINSFGYIGRGDNELVDYNRCSINPNEKKLCAIDKTGKKLEVDLQTISDGVQPIMKVSKMAGMPSALHLCQLKDKILFMGHINPRLAITNLSGTDTLSSYNDFPHITTEIDNDTSAKAYYYFQSSSYALNHNRSKLCHTTRNGMILEIFEINHMNNITLKKTRYFYPTKMKNMIKAADDCVKGFIQTRATDKYIYALYDDTERKEQGTFPKLGVFNWNGEEIWQYQLDAKVLDFAIAEDDSYACCWAQNLDGEEYLGYFDLKWI